MHDIFQYPVKQILRHILSMIENDDAWPQYDNDFFELETFTTDTELEW